MPSKKYSEFDDVLQIRIPDLEWHVGALRHIMQLLLFAPSSD